MKAPPMGEDTLKDLRIERQELQRLLALERASLRRWAASFWRRGFRSLSVDDDKASSQGQPSDRERRVLRDPEARKNIEILAAHISDAIDLHRRTPIPEPVTRSLAELVFEARAMLSLETLLDARRSLEELLLQCADLTLLQQWAAAEYAEAEATLTTWQRLYGTELPQLLNDRPDPSSQAIKDLMDSTRVRLQRLVASRFWLYRPLRARRELRTIYLRRFAVWVLLFGVVLGAAIAWQVTAGTRAVLLAAAAGASGASLSGLLKFRDEVRLGAQIKEFGALYLAQVIVGGVFGLLVFLVVTTGWLGLGTDAARIGVISFAAGFSEPFAVGIVAKMTERASG
jgi:hypothetical protein